MKHRRCKLIKPHHYGPLQPPLITSAMPLGSSLALELIRKQVCAKYGPSNGPLLSEAAMKELIKKRWRFF